MAKPDELPSGSVLHQYATTKDYVDSYSVELSDRADLQHCDIRILATQFGTIEIGWIVQLLKLRDILMKPLQLKTTDMLSTDHPSASALDKQVGDRIAFFKIYEIHQDEIILGEDDWHQDFRVSLYRTHGHNPRVIMTTVCKRHNAFGYAYLATILPFHKLIVKTTLNEGVSARLVVN